MNKDRFYGRGGVHAVTHDNAFSFGLNTNDLVEACKGNWKGNTRRIKRWFHNFAHNFISPDNNGQVSLTFQYNTVGYTSHLLLDNMAVERDAYFQSAIATTRWSLKAEVERAAMARALQVKDWFKNWLKSQVDSGRVPMGLAMPKLVVELHDEWVAKGRQSEYYRLPRLYLELPNDWRTLPVKEQVFLIEVINQVTFCYRDGILSGWELAEEDILSWNAALDILQEDAHEERKRHSSEAKQEQERQLHLVRLRVAHEDNP